MLLLDNTEIAFASKSNKALKKAYLIFSIIAKPWLNRLGTQIVQLSFKLRLPIKGLIKASVFNHFCGGENIETCKTTIAELNQFDVGTILDYSVEGKQEELAFENCLHELLVGIQLAKQEKAIPFCVVKLTGLIPFEILQKLDAKIALTTEEERQFNRGKSRVHQIAKAASEADTPFMIDAEESWIQDSIDQIVFELMLEFNRTKALIYNTAQMYRHDRMAYLNDLFEKATQHNIYIGLKIVRGAYMEKERERALTNGYPSPIQPTKEATDSAFNTALKFCVEKRNRIAVCCGTHNEESSLHLVHLMEKNQISKQNKSFYFAQLLGMSDHISYNLAKAGYKVAKYVPYGPVKEVMPYLIRRADENTSVAGQTGRELSLIRKELKRRGLS